MKRNLFLLSACGFIEQSHFYAGIIMPFLSDVVKLNYISIFTLQAIFSGTILLSEIPTGLLADKIGRKHSLNLGLMVLVLAYLVFTFATSFTHVLCAEILCAVGGSCINGADKALIYDSLVDLRLESQSTNYFSRYQAAANLGMVISLGLGPLILAFDAVNNGLLMRIPFAVTAFLHLVACILSLFLKESSAGNLQKQRLKLQDFACIKPCAPVMVNYAIIGATLFPIVWLYQPALRSAGVSISLFGIWGAVFNIAGIAVLLFISHKQASYSIRKVIFLTGALAGVGYLILSASSQRLLPVLFGCLLTFTLRAARTPFILDFLNAHFPSHLRATMLSTVSAMQTAVLCLIYPLIGLLIDRSLVGCLFALGIVTLVGSILIFFMPEPERPDTRSPEVKLST